MEHWQTSVIPGSFLVFFYLVLYVQIFTKFKRFLPGFVIYFIDKPKQERQYKYITVLLGAFAPTHNLQKILSEETLPAFP